MAYCANCGSKLNDGAKFCSKCGSRVGETVSVESRNINKGKNNKFLFIIGVVVLVSLMFVGIIKFIKKEPKNLIGNHMGNIQNDSLVTKEGKWVYYINEFDGGRIYKMKEDGSNRTRINDDKSWGINVVDGWIYYINLDDGGKIYKIKNNGKERTRLNNEDSWSIIVVGDWIYYISFNDKDDEENILGGKICRIKTDGTEYTCITEDKSWGLNLIGEWIYYINQSDGGKIYKVKTDGTQSTALNNEKSWGINVLGDFIYYIKTNDSEENKRNVESGKIYRMKLDGTEQKCISEDNSSAINIYNNFIYYINQNDGGSIYKMTLDGEQHSKISKDITSSINIIGDWVYYKNENNEGSLYKIKVDGTERQSIEKAVKSMRKGLIAKVHKKTIKYENQYIDVDIETPIIYGIGNKVVEHRINRSIERLDYKEMEEEAKEILSEFETEVPFMAKQNFEVTYNKNGILSLNMLDTLYTGGAHENFWKSGYTFDLKTGNIYKLKDLFKDDSYKEIISKEMIRQLNAREPEGANYLNYEPLENVTGEEYYYITDKGIVIVYQTYDIGSFADGIFEFEIPFNLFREHLKVELAKN